MGVLMVQYACDPKTKITTVDNDCIIFIDELKPYHSDTYGYHKQIKSLPMSIFRWAQKNKCMYKKTFYLDPESNQFTKAFVFESGEAASKFRERWVDTIIYLDEWLGTYDFISKITWRRGEIILTKEAYHTMMINKIKITERTRDWFLFETANDAMVFKLSFM